MTTPYPLSWPANIARARHRDKGAFRTKLQTATSNVRTSLNGFARDSGKALTDVVISSNVTLGIERPTDPGVAVWFVWDRMPICIPIDRYATVEANLQAIHHVLEARRTEIRHGTLALVRASLAGLLALPSPPARPWHEVLEVEPGASPEEIRRAYVAKAATVHPDKGGSSQAMAELNAARDEALRRQMVE